MKKILALVLAVSMMATTAFATVVEMTGGPTGVTSAKPGDTLNLAPAGFSANPTSTGVTGLAGVGYYFNSEYFTLSTKKITKGANLIKSFKFNDEEARLEIVLNQDYTLKTPTVPNLMLGEIVVKAKKAAVATGGTIAKNATFTWNGTLATTNIMNVMVGYTTVPSTGTLADGVMNQIVITDAYTDASYSSGFDFDIEGRAYKNDKILVTTDATPNDAEKALLKVDANINADIRFVNFTTNGLPSSFKAILSVEEDQFIYELDAKGMLTESKMKWSTEDSAWTSKIRSSVNYVISDIKLVAAPVVDDAGKPVDPALPTNPSTGANDVVGIAAALAVVSLVAAGAVSLKK